MSDDQLIDRALRAGWEWFDHVSDRWPGTPKYPSTGWLHERGSFSNSKSDGLDKAAMLRAEGEGRGFDHDLDCRECGKPIWLYWMKDCEERLIKAQECFECNHFLQLSRLQDRSCCAVIDGHHWMIEKDAPKGYGGFVGCGGGRHVIVFNDGRKVITHNLWHQGTIPQHLRHKLPDNAVFSS